MENEVVDSGFVTGAASRSESSHDASEAVNHLEKGDAASEARHLVVGLIRKAIGG